MNFAVTGLSNPKKNILKRASMYKLMTVIGIVALMSTSYAQSLYDINTIQTIAITFPQSNWDYLLDTAKAGSDGYIMAQSVTINGTRYDSVGVKYKGNSTYSPNYKKNPFHIELDTYKPEKAEHEFYTINAATGDGSDIVMNEIYSRGTTADPDWIELYNPSSAAMDVSGYKAYDVGGQSGSKTKKQVPAGTVPPSGGLLIIVTDDTTSSGFGLSNSGEKVWLENASGVIVDSVTYLGHTAVQSYGRIPDGGDWQLLNTITRGSSNGSVSAFQEELAAPTNFVLSQNYPNPFNPTTTISFTLPIAAFVSLKVFDNLGREVSTLCTGELAAGTHSRQKVN
jgi:hypothetical protein